MYFVLILLVTLATSCASMTSPRGGPARESWTNTNSQEAVVWPVPPEKARIKFLYAFRDTEDLDFPVSVFARLKRLIVGERDHGMIRPYSLAVDGDMVAVVDPGARALYFFDLNRRKYRKIIKAGDDFFLSPVGVAIGRDKIYLSDSSLGKVFALDHKGRHLFTIEDAARPTGLAFEKETSRLYVSDTLGFRICAYDPHGKRLFSFGKRGTGEGEFNYPTHLFLKGDTLLVNDTMNFRVQAFDLQGNHLFSFGKHGDGSGEMAQPKGVGIDSEGHVYVADALSDRVQIFDTQGRFLLAFGRPGSGAGEFWLPAGLFIAQDRIYVADSYNRRVQVFQFLGSEQR
jgi:DNA-binding beta-propeller fold protein YncE